MRHISKKLAKLNRQAKPLEKAYRAEFHTCMVCPLLRMGGTFIADELHHIARGVHREAAKLEPATWLMVCKYHHEYMDDYSLWPITRQLAVKLLADPARFDLNVFNAIRGRAEGAIDLADVVKHLELK